MNNNTSTNSESETKTLVLVGKWGKPTCEGCLTMVNVIFKDDNECNCGCARHHYHCSICGGIAQIG